MPECLNCGGHVTEQFARVLGDNNDDIHHCRNCNGIGATDLYRGAGAQEDFESRVQAGYPVRSDGGSE